MSDNKGFRGDELLTLGDEMRAARDTQRLPEFNAAHAAGTRMLILDEESRAWEFGREVLQRVGFVEWAAFEERRDHGLAVYREILDLP